MAARCLGGDACVGTEVCIASACGVPPTIDFGDGVSRTAIGNADVAMVKYLD